MEPSISVFGAESISNKIWFGILGMKGNMWFQLLGSWMPQLLPQTFTNHPSLAASRGKKAPKPLVEK